jgi:hypothetical protein
LGLHAAQLLAWMPQRLKVGGLTQAVPLQQPASQVVASHTQLPPTQCWPEPQAAPEPHEQLPPLQPSATVELQPEQPRPPVPHWVLVGGEMQVAPEQQPLAQLPAVQPVHAWLVQVWPVHAAHVAPPVPHWVSAVPGWQMLLLSQQPLEQLVASHTHTPPEQRWPDWQAKPPPQEQVPCEVHRSERLSQAAQALAGAPHAAVDWLAGARQVLDELQQPPGQLPEVQTQMPLLLQTWPATQGLPAPHLHAPLTQALVRPEHTAHAAPPVPHWDVLWPAPV